MAWLPVANRLLQHTKGVEAVLPRDGTQLAATRDFFDRMNRTPERALSIIGAHPA